MQQKSLFPARFSLAHGGTLAPHGRKGRRPLARKRPIHFVLKSKRALYPKRALIERELRRLGEKFSLRLYGIAVAHDHVHFVARIPGRAEYKAFIRALTGILARKLGRGVWALPPFSRIASWGRAFVQLKKYLQQNREEAAGTRPYAPRKDWHARYLKSG